MSGENELGTFLRSARARIGPDDLGLAPYHQRRVPGLRREELAQLAGVSVSYYTRIEQGQTRNASPAVLESLARVLRLTVDERAHLLRLANPTRRPSRSSPPERVRPSLKGLVEGLSVPAVVAGRWMDLLAWNPMGHALVAGHLPFDAPESTTRRPNWAKMLFADPHTSDLFVDGTAKQRDVVAYLRFQAVQYPEDRRLAEVIGELSMESREFAKLWAHHEVKDKRPSTVQIRHPLVGLLSLHNETLRSPEAPDQMLATFHGIGPADQAGLQLLLISIEGPSPTTAASPVSAAEQAQGPRR